MPSRIVRALVARVASTPFVAVAPTPTRVPVRVDGIKASAFVPTATTASTTAALQMTGLRGGGLPGDAVIVDARPLEMTGLRGVSGPAVTLVTGGLAMTGLRGQAPSLSFEKALT